MFVKSSIFMQYHAFLHDWSWISTWINCYVIELDITFHVLVSQMSGHCDIRSRYSNCSWCHQQVRHGFVVWRSLFLLSFMDFLCRVGNIIMHVFSWWSSLECYFGVYFLSRGEAHPSVILVFYFPCCWWLKMEIKFFRFLNQLIATLWCHMAT